MIKRRDPDFFRKFRMAGCLGDKRQPAFFLISERRSEASRRKPRTLRCVGGSTCHLLTDIQKNVKESSGNAASGVLSGTDQIQKSIPACKFLTEGINPPGKLLGDVQIGGRIPEDSFRLHEPVVEGQGKILRPDQSEPPAATSFKSREGGGRQFFCQSCHKALPSCRAVRMTVASSSSRACSCRRICAGGGETSRDEVSGAGAAPLDDRFRTVRTLRHLPGVIRRGNFPSRGIVSGRDGALSSLQGFQILDGEDVVRGRQERLRLPAEKGGEGRFLSGLRKGFSLFLVLSRRSCLVILRLLQKESRRFFKGSQFSKLTSEAEGVHHTRGIQKLHGPLGEIFCASGGGRRREAPGRDRLRF